MRDHTYSWGVGSALVLSLAIDLLQVVFNLTWGGVVASSLALAVAAALLVAGVRRSAQASLEGRQQRNLVWATLADGLSKLAAGNLTWTIKPEAAGDESAADCIQGFNDVTSEPCQRLFYVGSDSQLEGQMAGKTIGQHLRRGKLAVFVGSFEGVNYALRRKGALTELRDHHPEVQESALLESRGDPEHAYQQTARLLASDPHLAGIYVTEGGSPAGVARAVADAGRAGQVLVFAHDLTPATMDALGKGLIAATIFQDPFAQGYDPAVRIFNYLVDGHTPSTSRLSTQVRSVTRENMAEFWDLRQNRSLAGDRSRLVVPVRASERKLRIAVAGLANNEFWAEVKAGTMAASAVLEPLGCHVEWLVPTGSDEPERIANLGQTIREVVGAKYDGLVLPIHDRGLVKTVNQAVVAGVVAATYNTEPLSLRQTLATVAVQAKHQLSLSADLDEQAQRGERSARKIADSLSLMNEGLGSQKARVSQTSNNLETLGTTLKTIDAAARSSGEATRKVARAAEDSVESLKRSLGSMTSLEASSKAIGRSVDELKQETARIAENVNFIGDIANRTNTLAINASIEAARAGISGKGFAVIASEIRHLSDQANTAANSIAKLLESIGTKVEHVETTTKATLDDTQRTHNLAARSEESLSVIHDASVESEQKTGVILSSVQEVASFSAEIEAIVKNLNQTNEEWNRAVRESLASTEEMTQVVEKIAQDAHTLSDRSRSQEGMLRQFKLGED